MTLIDPSALTSDDAVQAGAAVLAAKFDRWGITGHGRDTTREILAAVASALAAQGAGGIEKPFEKPAPEGTGGDDAGEAADLFAREDGVWDLEVRDWLSALLIDHRPPWVLLSREEKVRVDSALHDLEGILTRPAAPAPNPQEGRRDA